MSDVVPVPPPRERRRVRTPVGERSLTKQSEADATDVNTIVNKYRQTGELPHLMRVSPRYGDFSNAEDYLSAMLQVKEADRLFAELPSHVREHVQNNPAKLLEMVYDPDRVDECRALGLVSERDPEPPDVGEPPVAPKAPGEPPAPAEPPSEA